MAPTAGTFKHGHRWEKKQWGSSPTPNIITTANQDNYFHFDISIRIRYNLRRTWQRLSRCGRVRVLSVSTGGVEISIEGIAKIGIEKLISYFQLNMQQLMHGLQIIRHDSRRLEVVKQQGASFLINLTISTNQIRGQFENGSSWLLIKRLDWEMSKGGSFYDRLSAASAEAKCAIKPSKQFQANRLTRFWKVNTRQWGVFRIRTRLKMTTSSVNRFTFSLKENFPMAQQYWKVSLIQIVFWMKCLDFFSLSLPLSLFDQI